MFVFERTTQKTLRVSVRSTGAQANRGSFDPSISADGRFVAYDLAMTQGGLPVSLDGESLPLRYASGTAPVTGSGWVWSGMGGGPHFSPMFASASQTWAVPALATKRRCASSATSISST